MNRRDVLKSMLAAGVGMSSMAATANQLKVLKAMTSQTRFDDYKALVCVFLYGGNDSYNMLIPTESSDYQTYAAVRQNLAIEQASLLPLLTSSDVPYQLGLPPSMASAGELFSQQKLAFVSNVGPLVEPTTKADITANRIALPPQLFSHNDQQKLWELANNDINGINGWAGRVADLLLDVNPESSISLNLSLAGNNVMQTAQNKPLYSLTSAGVDMFAGLNPRNNWNERRISAFDRLAAMEQHELGKSYRGIFNRARNNALVVSSALDTAPELQQSFADNDLENNLAMVAKLISVQQQLGMQRQIFFVGLGGWDTHDRQNEDHPQLLATLANGLKIFELALQELGVSEQVTTFTSSEFGRTLTSNGDGTDHGWGGHHMVMGGAVQGGQIYGQLPSLELNSDDDIGEGRIIPTTSSESYAATLAKWFGLTDSEIATVFPTLNRFDAPMLNFV